MAYDRNSTVGEIISDPIALEVMEEIFPGVTSHPMINYALNMTLEDLAAYPQSETDPEQIDNLLEAINKRLGLEDSKDE